MSTATAVTPASHPVLRKRSRSLIRTIDLTIWVTAGVASVVIAALVLIYGVEFSRVLSPSMAPDMPVGSVAVTSHIPADDLRVGQVAILRTPDEHALYIHRIVSLQYTPDGMVIRTKGDANPSADPWTVIVKSPEVAVLVFVLPTQRITDIAMRFQFIAFPLFIFGVLMTAYFGWYAMKRQDETAAAPEFVAPSDPHDPGNDDGFFNI